MIASYVTKVAELERQVVGLKEENENLGKENADLVPINRDLQLENKLLADGTEKDVEEFFEKQGDETTRR
jgi:regulator of replication initiation timing